MKHPVRPAPQVTVSRPAGVVDQPVELLAGAPERPRRTVTPQARRAVLAVAALAVAAAGAVTVDRERRVGATVALTLVSDGHVDGRPVWELTGRTAFVRYRADVRNDGPRPVTVDRAELGSLRSNRQPRPLEPGQQVGVTLSRVVRCQDPKAAVVPAALSVAVTTQRGSRATLLPAPAGLRAQLDRAADRACGVLPLIEALAIRATSLERVGGTVLIRLEAANASTRPLRLVRAVVQQGFRGVVRDPVGRALTLPLDLPPASLGQPPVAVPLVLELTVVRCAAIFELTPFSPGQPSLDTLSFAVDGGAGPLVGPVLLDLDDPTVKDLVDRAC